LNISLQRWSLERGQVRAHSMMIVYWSLFLALLIGFIVFIVAVFKDFTDSYEQGKKSSRAVRTGVIAQSLSFSLAWMFRRPRVNPFGGGELWPDVLIAAFSLALACGAVSLAVASKKHLGMHWAMAARVLGGHRLVTTGPFGRVRHPLYLAMGLLLLSPVAGLSSWFGAATALPLFSYGTYLRARAEEEVLGKAFGPEYEGYRRRVPAFVPRLRRA
jgi:protein-S-isoprenylcysteine O-methyltransferase Ste14